MSRRRSPVVTELDARPWVAIVGETPHVYKTRAGAVNRLVDELEHWIRWARFYDHTAIEPLVDVRDKIASATGNADYTFTVAALPGHVALRRVS